MEGLLESHQSLLTIVMRCTIWYHLHYLRNATNTHGEVLLSVKLQAKSYTPPWVFSHFLNCPNRAKHMFSSTLREIHVFTVSPGVSELVLKGGAWKKWPFITIFQLKILVPESTKYQHQIKVHKISTELLP